MTVTECVGLADSMLPNGFSSIIKIRWLSELEGRIKVELMEEAVPVKALTSTNGSTQLSVPHPYDQLYWMYLVAMMHHMMGDRDRYENSAALFNTAYQNFAKYVHRKGEAYGRRE